jgi:hypothetical protein
MITKYYNFLKNSEFLTSNTQILNDFLSFINNSNLYDKLITIYHLKTLNLIKSSDNIDYLLKNIDVNAIYIYDNIFDLLNKLPKIDKSDRPRIINLYLKDYNKLNISDITNFISFIKSNNTKTSLLYIKAQLYLNLI